MSIATKNILLKTHSLFWLATSVLITITSQPVLAFTLTPGRGWFGLSKGASVRYLPRDTGSDEIITVGTWLDPKLVTEINQ